MIEEHELGSGKVGFTLDGELVGPMGQFGLFHLLHGGALEEGRLVAGVKEGRGRDRVYEGWGTAARGDCLVGFVILAIMTWGLRRCQ